MLWNILTNEDQQIDKTGVDLILHIKTHIHQDNFIIDPDCLVKANNQFFKELNTSHNDTDILIEHWLNIVAVSFSKWIRSSLYSFDSLTLIFGRILNPLTFNICTRKHMLNLGNAKMISVMHRLQLFVLFSDACLDDPYNILLKQFDSKTDISSDTKFSEMFLQLISPISEKTESTTYLKFKNQVLSHFSKAA